MAVRFLNGGVSELCLGKPQLAWVPAAATVAAALAALKTSGDTHLTVWLCGGGGGDGNGSSCVCVGKLCMTDVILFLCKEENVADPFKALEAPVSDILPKGFPIVTHLQPNSSLLDAVHYILEGTQNLIVPIRKNNHKKKFLNQKTCPCHTTHEYCWLTQEDVIRFFLNSIASFSPIPTLTIESLDVIDREILTVHYNQPASSLLAHLHRALAQQTSIAIVDEGHRLIGEISPSNLTCCDETVAAAIKTLSAVDLMTYIGGPPEDLVQLTRARLEERGLGRMVEMMDEIVLRSLMSSSSSSSSFSSCSSDDETLLAGRNIPTGHSRYYYRSEAIVCSRGSSLVAVMIQALAHRVGCVWVVDEDQTVVGMVTFRGILRVLCGRGRSKSEMD